MGLRPTLSFASLGLAACLLMPTHSAHFREIAFSLIFFWAFNIPYYLGLLSELDPTGRLAVATSAMIPFGMAAGQAAAGPVILWWGFRTLTMTGAGAVLAGLIASLCAAGHLSRRVSRR